MEETDSAGEGIKKEGRKRRLLTESTHYRRSGSIRERAREHVVEGSNSAGKNQIGCRERTPEHIVRRALL